MMEWNEYISYLLSVGESFDNLSISLDEGYTETEIPPIIKTSIFMLDRMVEKQGKYNVLVFPEKVQSIFIFILMKLFHNISSGKIETNYDPTGFRPGEKLKVGNAVVEYLGINTEEGKQPYMSIRLADLDMCKAPLSNFPIFQKVSTNRKLSKKAQYAAEKKKVLGALDADRPGSEKLLFVANMKTHMSSSIFAMTSVTGIKEQLRSCRIDGKKVTDIFYIGQADYEGKISNISPGQMSGIPAIVFASDMYAINTAATDGKPIQSIIIDGSNANFILDQLDVLDDLMKLDKPIVCITDVANSFELGALVTRGFNIWRWDKDSITPQLFDAVPLSSDKKIKNCVKQSVIYMKADGAEISKAMSLLAIHRKETENQSPQLMKVYERLNTLTFAALRNTIPMTEIEADLANKILSDCQKTIENESSFISEAVSSDYSLIIDYLKEVYTPGYQFKKEEMLKAYLKEHRTENIYLIIPEKSSKTQIRDYWSGWCWNQDIEGHVRVLYPSEYYSYSPSDADTTIICGWLKRAIMRKLVFGFNTSNYIILLYDYENRWKNHDAKRWSRALDNSGNRDIIEKSFATDGIKVSTIRFNKKTDQPETPDLPDELGEIELILRDNRYRQFIKSGGHAGTEIVTAVPVNFVGGYLAFYRTGHKVISATKIILGDADKIETKFPAELHVGDFIVVKESDKDIVRELADIALRNSGKGHLRELSSKWKEALKIELLFCTTDEFCDRMIAAGCNKGVPTIKHWLEDEDVIAPRSRDDLKIMADLTENETLNELLDDILEAAQEVRNAHVLAGRKLSEQLKVTLADELKKREDIDPFNFWEPIDMEIEGIGNVKVLKIIDVGTELQIESSDTNRLIEE